MIHHKTDIFSRLKHIKSTRPFRMLIIALYEPLQVEMRSSSLFCHHRGSSRLAWLDTVGIFSGKKRVFSTVSSIFWMVDWTTRNFRFWLKERMIKMCNGLTYHTSRFSEACYTFPGYFSALFKANFLFAYSSRLLFQHIRLRLKTVNMFKNSSVSIHYVQSPSAK